MFRSTHSLLLGCGLAWLLVAPLSARAQSTLLWGVSRGCEVDAILTKVVKDHLDKAALPVTPLGATTAATSAQEAVAELRKQCPGVQGRVLGGYVEAGGAERFRLWMYDLGTEQVAYVDGYCSEATCRLREQVGLGAIEIVDKPVYGRTGEKPSYCEPQGVSAASQEVRSRKVVVVLSWPAGSKPAMQAAVQRDLSAADREASVAKADGKNVLTAGQMKKLLGADASGQVLGMEPSAKGASLWVFDGASEQRVVATVECPGCSPAELADKASVRAVSLLSEASKPEAPKKPPPESACTPIAEPQCAKPSANAPAISPGIAKLVKGSLWGLFAASAATTMTLAILNETTVGDQVARFQTFHHQLTPAVWTMAGMATLSLAISIPTTVVLAKKSTDQPVVGSASPSLTCPTH